MAKWYYGLQVTHYGYDAGGNVFTIHTNGGGLPNNISCTLIPNPRGGAMAGEAFLSLANTAWLTTKRVNLYGTFDKGRQVVEVSIIEVA